MKTKQTQNKIQERSGRGYSLLSACLALVISLGAMPASAQPTVPVTVMMNYGTEGMLESFSRPDAWNLTLRNRITGFAFHVANTIGHNPNRMDTWVVSCEDPDFYDPESKRHSPQFCGTHGPDGKGNTVTNLKRDGVHAFKKITRDWGKEFEIHPHVVVPGSCNYMVTLPTTIEILNNLATDCEGSVCTDMTKVGIIIDEPFTYGTGPVSEGWCGLDVQSIAQQVVAYMVAVRQHFLSNNWGNPKFGWWEPLFQPVGFPVTPTEGATTSWSEFIPVVRYQLDLIQPAQRPQLVYFQGDNTCAYSPWTYCTTAGVSAVKTLLANNNFQFRANINDIFSPGAEAYYYTAMATSDFWVGAPRVDGYSFSSWHHANYTGNPAVSSVGVSHRHPVVCKYPEVLRAPPEAAYPDYSLQRIMLESLSSLGILW